MGVLHFNEEYEKKYKFKTISHNIVKNEDIVSNDIEQDVETINEILNTEDFIIKGDDSYMCGKCGKEFPRKYNVKLHLQNKKRCDDGIKMKIDGVLRYYCKYCGNNYCRKNYLNSHIKKFHQSDIMDELESLKKKLIQLETK